MKIIITLTIFFSSISAFGWNNEIMGVYNNNGFKTKSYRQDPYDSNRINIYDNSGFQSGSIRMRNNGFNLNTGRQLRNKNSFPTYGGY